MKTVDIKGKAYVQVNERIKFFRESYKSDFSLESEIIELNDKFCVIRASIKDKDGRVLAQGLAREVNGDSFINKTSYVENCETSAWGRALGNFGIGIDDSIATFEEVSNAILNQNEPINSHGEDTFLAYQDQSIFKINQASNLEELVTAWDFIVTNVKPYYAKHKASAYMDAIISEKDKKKKELTGGQNEEN